LPSPTAPQGAGGFAGIREHSWLLTRQFEGVERFFFAWDLNFLVRSKSSIELAEKSPKRARGFEGERAESAITRRDQDDVGFSAQVSEKLLEIPKIFRGGLKLGADRRDDFGSPLAFGVEDKLGQEASEVHDLFASSGRQVREKQLAEGRQVVEDFAVRIAGFKPLHENSSSKLAA
jgi:hypothetical protein